MITGRKSAPAFHFASVALSVAISGLAGCRDPGLYALELLELLPEHRPEGSRDAGHQTLRVRLDPLRNRRWVLTLDHVEVHDILLKELVRRIPLPGWSVAQSLCPPDLALDRSGTATISHNVEPRLWQIEAEGLELDERVIRLPDEELREIGFGALAYAPDGALFGIAAAGGSLWSIDIGKASAHRVETDAPMMDVCALEFAPLMRSAPPVDTIVICAIAWGQSRRIVLSLDPEHARVTDEAC